MQPGNTAKSPAPGGHRWVIAAVLFTAAVSLALMFLPLVGGTAESQPARSSSGSSGGTMQTDQQSMMESEGWTVAATLSVPVLISALPLLVPARHRRWTTIGSAVLLTTGALLGAASVGLFYLPSAALLVVAALRTRT